MINMSFRRSSYRSQGWGTIGSYIFSLIFMYFFFITTTSTFQYLGFNPLIGLIFLFVSILGSSINIPITTLVSENMQQEYLPVNIFGITYQIPKVQKMNRTLLTINVGGAIIPLILCVILFILNPAAILYSIPTIIIASLIINHFARPIKGMGIAIPFLIPAGASVLLSLVVSINRPELAPVVAYVTGVLGSLIGADLLNLKKIPDLGAPVASIGGAGTFDGIFISGILSVALIILFG